MSDSRETDRIIALVEPAVTALGLEVVRVSMTGVDHVILQIMVDRADGRPIDVDDCADA